MRVIVLGAGVVGISTTWQLLSDGHDVVVVDRADQAASFSSYANAGCVGAGYAFAWGSPRAIGAARRSLLKGDQLVRLRPSLSPEMWNWLLAFRRECTADRAAANTAAMASLSAYSQTVLRAVVKKTQIAFDRNAGGLIYFFRHPESLQRASDGASLLRDGGVEIEVVDATGVRNLLGSAACARSDAEGAEIVGGLFAPNDESGDARLFTLALAECCRAAGADLRFGETVRSVLVENGKAYGVVTDQGVVEADAVVVCLGAYSRELVQPILRSTGRALQVHPVKGYSATFPVGDSHQPPSIGGVDVDAGLAFAPMGSRLRMTRTLHFDGYRTSHRPKDFRVLLQKARAAFPAGAHYDRPVYWAGLRPMTPTGLPVIDQSPVTGLWLNTGQGNFGWTMASGSARILADLLLHRDPAISVKPLMLPA